MTQAEITAQIEDAQARLDRVNAAAATFTRMYDRATDGSPQKHRAQVVMGKLGVRRVEIERELSSLVDQLED